MWYLWSSSHHLRRVEALELVLRVSPDRRVLLRQDGKDEFSVYVLADRPAQPGQAAWRDWQAGEHTGGTR